MHQLQELAPPSRERLPDTVAEYSITAVRGARRLTAELNLSQAELDDAQRREAEQLRRRARRLRMLLYRLQQRPATPERIYHLRDLQAVLQIICNTLEEELDAELVA